MSVRVLRAGDAVALYATAVAVGKNTATVRVADWGGQSQETLVDRVSVIGVIAPRAHGFRPGQRVLALDMPEVELEVIWIDGEDVWLKDPRSGRRFTRFPDQVKDASDE